MVANHQPAKGLALFALAASAALSLAACSRGPDNGNLDSLDAELADRNNAAPARDPALVNALQDDIMVDPQLAHQANHDAIRPPARPYAAPVAPDAVGNPRAPVDAASLRHAPAPAAGCPECKRAQGALTLGALAQRQRDRRTAQCGATVQYSNGWATRLPADVPLYPDARVTEAAGANDNGCALRVVSFSTAAPVQTVVDWYYTRTSGAGFAAEHQVDGEQHVLGGTRARDGGAFVLYVTRRDGGGSDVDLVTNNGR